METDGVCHLGQGGTCGLLQKSLGCLISELIFNPFVFSSPFYPLFSPSKRGGVLFAWWLESILTPRTLSILPCPLRSFVQSGGSI